MQFVNTVKKILLFFVQFSYSLYLCDSPFPLPDCARRDCAVTVPEYGSGLFPQEPLLPCDGRKR